jgi:hypothetical protein
MVLRQPGLIDLRNIDTLDEAKAAGFKYEGVGRDWILPPGGL